MISSPNVLYPRLTSFCEIGPVQRAELEDLVDYVVLMTAARAYDTSTNHISADQSKIAYMETVRQKMDVFKRECLEDLLGPQVQD
jgi:hypothetical protein